ncbi:hypothetical protein BDY19DRAFT_904278 [Irpex rosettiformis]|uniref:Uncharacterized protein n=1 Tax=Irpex rosettiformis TaxID=378272 RepID=A0ACB8UBL2_9APHY|nr:hypothetical protein BDY19DRAFT_904278 [Irpex rosettiformis]
MAFRKTMVEPPCVTSDSLDLTELISRNPTESILNASITFLSLTDSTRSLHSSPSIPSTFSRPIVVTLSPGHTLFDRSKEATAGMTIPTVPRLKRIIKEPIAVARWAESITSSPLLDHEPWESADVEDVPRTGWTPSGSMFSREALRTALRKTRLPHSESWTLVIQTALEHEDSFLDRSEASIMLSNIVNVSACIGNSTKDDMVPTILLSNSTAVMPLPLESAQSVSQLASAPRGLAVRRGRSGPPALPLPSLPVPATDLYPSIPTPFRGSPTAYSPKFEFYDPNVDFTMDLEAMCQDLRLRCPPLAPPSPVFLTSEGPLLDVSPVLASPTDTDSDEWDFARELLETHIERSQLSSAGHTPIRPTLPGLAGDALLDHGTPKSSSDVSWETEPTLTNSPPVAQQLELALEESEEKEQETIKPAPPSEHPKQQRRRTVIIETPRSSVGARPMRMTVDLSHLADKEENTETPEPVTAEIPFESQPQGFSPTWAPDVQDISGSHVRPISSASMGRPVRSILKTREKKSVRFSELPCTHEYSIEGRELDPVSEGDGIDDVSIQDRTRENTKSNSGGRKRAGTTPSYQSQRKSMLADSSNGRENDQLKRASFPKHPAVRVLTRSSTPGQVTSPTPNPKGGKSGHQSMLVDRTIDKVDIGRPKRLTGVPVGRSSVLADNKQSLRKKQSKDENSWRRSKSSPTSPEKSPTSAQKSRMPFKSILTKLRS